MKVITIILSTFVIKNKLEDYVLQRLIYIYNEEFSIILVFIKF